MEIETKSFEDVKRNVIHLAASLGIMIKIDQTLVDDSRDDEMNDISCRGSLRVRNIEEMVILSGDQRHYEKDRSHGREDVDREEADEDDGVVQINDHTSSSKVRETPGPKKSSITYERDEDDFEDPITESRIMDISVNDGGNEDETGNQAEDSEDTLPSANEELETDGEASVEHRCGECGKVFSRKRGLWRHTQSVHDRARYTCVQCGKQFTSPDNLRQHIRTIHEGVKYSCDRCGKQFTSPSTLKLHIRSVHEGIKFPCGECGKIFKYKGDLRKHSKKHK